MKIAIDAARFTPDEANELRKAMATFRSRGTIENSRTNGRAHDRRAAMSRILPSGVLTRSKALANTVSPKAMRPALPIWSMSSSLDEMPLPRCLCLRACSIPNRWGSMRPPKSCAMPVDHGVEVRGVDVDFSEWDCTLEPCADGSFALAPWGCGRWTGCATDGGLSAIVEASRMCTFR